jgi:hypothetical protein
MLGSPSPLNAPNCGIAASLSLLLPTNASRVDHDFVRLVCDACMQPREQRDLRVVALKIVRLVNLEVGWNFEALDRLKHLERSNHHGVVRDRHVAQLQRKHTSVGPGVRHSQLKCARAGRCAAVGFLHRSGCQRAVRRQRLRADIVAVGVPCCSKPPFRECVINFMVTIEVVLSLPLIGVLKCVVGPPSHRKCQPLQRTCEKRRVICNADGVVPATRNSCLCQKCRWFPRTCLGSSEEPSAARCRVVSRDCIA